MSAISQHQVPLKGHGVTVLDNLALQKVAKKRDDPEGGGGGIVRGMGPRPGSDGLKRGHGD